MPRKKVPLEQRVKPCAVCGESFNYSRISMSICSKHGKYKNCRCIVCGSKYIHLHNSTTSSFTCCSVECKKNKVNKIRSYKPRTCPCGVVFKARAHNHTLCDEHKNKFLKTCQKCGENIWVPTSTYTYVGKYSCKTCGPEKVKKASKMTKLKPKPTPAINLVLKPKTTKPSELKPAIPLQNGHPKGSTIEKAKNDACAVCAIPLHSKNYTQVYCADHRYYHKKQCRYCKEAFHSPKAEKQLYCHETCRLNDQKPCQVCGVYFQPLTKGQIYCEGHNKGGPDANKYSIHWKMGAPAFVGNPKDNPYKAGVLKPCEATEKHPDCSGTMMVFANEWTRCIHCAKMLTRQSASISHVRDF